MAQAVAVRVSEKPPRFFKQEIIKIDPKATSKNPKRLHWEWLYYECMLQRLALIDKAKILVEIEKAEDIYNNAAISVGEKQKALDQLVKKMMEDANVGDPNSVINPDMKSSGFINDAIKGLGYWDPIIQLRHHRWLRDGKLFNWSEEHPFKAARARVLRYLISRDLQGKNTFDLLQIYFIEPMDGINEKKQLEAYSDGFLKSPALFETVCKGGGHADNLKWYKQDFDKAVCAYKEPGAFAKFCSRFKAHRDEFDMYAYDEYDEYDRLDLNANAYEADLEPLFDHDHVVQYEVQPQPVVISGYDAMSMDSNMVFATLFGVGLMSFVLCMLFVIAFGVAVGFGVYISSKRGTKSDHDNDRDLDPGSSGV